MRKGKSEVCCWFHANARKGVSGVSPSECFFFSGKLTKFGVRFIQHAEFGDSIFLGTWAVSLFRRAESRYVRWFPRFGERYLETCFLSHRDPSVFDYSLRNLKRVTRKARVSWCAAYKK